MAARTDNLTMTVSVIDTGRQVPPAWPRMLRRLLAELPNSSRQAPSTKVRSESSSVLRNAGQLSSTVNRGISRRSARPWFSRRSVS
jgi:hypothetical protein